MNATLAWIGMMVLAGGLVAAVVMLMRGPMRSLLTANGRLERAAGFYARSFVIVLVLAALSAAVGVSGPGGEKAAMEWVWWIVEGLKPVGWSVLGFLMGYVLLLTILYSALGRDRDQ